MTLPRSMGYKMKKLIALLLLLATIGLASCGSKGNKHDKYLVEVGNFIFYDDGEKHYLYGYSGIDRDVTLPESYNGKKYEINEYAFMSCSSIKTVTIPSGVTKIGAMAFEYCSSLEAVTIGNEVTYVDSGAFSGCKNLKSVVMGTAVEYISDGVFYNSKSLESVEFLKTEGWYLTDTYQTGSTEVDLTDKAENAKRFIGAWAKSHILYNLTFID